MSSHIHSGLSYQRWQQMCLTCLLTLFNFVSGVAVDQLCQHSGHCLNVGNTHHCQCQVGYTGSYCEVQLNECDSSPCQNGATCRDHLGGYQCEVMRGGLVGRGLNIWSIVMQRNQKKSETHASGRIASKRG